MDIKVVKIDADQTEQLIIRCHAVTDEVKEIITFARSRQGQLTGMLDEKQHEIPIVDVYYIEVVDDHTFIYTRQNVYETRSRLYELEEALKEKQFLRVSKSILLNLMKVTSIKPAFNGRFAAILPTGEEVIISRKYVKELKQALQYGRKPKEAVDKEGGADR